MSSIFEKLSLGEVIILLFVGVAVFLLGMNLMSSGLKKIAGKRVRTLFNKIGNNRFAGLGIGAAVTALIQSSAATSIMVIGFINAAVMSVFQAVSIIMGAYIGTTVTGLLVSLSSISGGFSIDIVFMILAFVGAIMAFINNKTIKNIGSICSGLGILFLGLFVLKESFYYQDINQSFQNIFRVISNPVLLLIIGALLTMLLQSSSASTGIMIVMVGTGAVGVSDAIYVAFGATIGTVVTTILATIVGSTNSKRTGIIVLLMRIIMATLFLAILWPLDASFGIIATMSSWFGNNTGLFVAVFMVIYNIITMLILLPFINPFIKLSEKFIKDKQAESMRSYLKYIDDKMLNNTSIAMMQVKKEIDSMNHLAKDNFVRSYNAIISQDLSEASEITKTEDAIDYLNIKITDFLIGVSKNADEDDLRVIGGFFHALNDIERIGDHAYNFLESAQKMKDLDLKFSSVARKELNEMYDLIIKMFEQTFIIFESKENSDVKTLHNLESQTDVLQAKLSSAHYERITKNECIPALSPFYSTLVSELERVADHLTNIGYVFVHPTGDTNKD